MPIDLRFIDFVAWLDRDFDLAVPHALLTAACALAALWVMQCLTRHAGVHSFRAVGLLSLRIALFMLSTGLALNVAFALNVQSEPWALDVAVRGLLLIVLITVPFALPKHLRQGEIMPAT